MTARPGNRPGRAPALAALVDLERYPVTDPHGAGAALVAECRRQLDASALCCLEGFLRPQALRDMRGEAVRAQPAARWKESERTAYSWRDLSHLPAQHPQRTLARHRIGTVTRDQLAADSALLALYTDDRLTEFVRRCLGFSTLHRVECPYLSLNLKVMDEGGCLGWHFDTNDGAVSLLLQSAREGGEYEYVPYIRSDDDENPAAVASVMKGEANRRVLRPGIRPGTFCLFKGNRSLHRVTEVRRGAPDRLIALFSYDERPGVRFSERTLETVLGFVPSA